LTAERLLGAEAEKYLLAALADRELPVRQTALGALAERTSKSAEYLRQALRILSCPISRPTMTSSRCCWRSTA